MIRIRSIDDGNPETVIKLHARGTVTAQKRIAEMNAAYAKWRREVEATGRSVRDLYAQNRGSERALQEVDHLSDAFKRLNKSAQDAGKSVKAIESLSGGPAVSPPSSGSGASGRSYASAGYPAWRSPRRQGFIRRPVMMGLSLLGLGAGFGAITMGIEQAKTYIVTLSDLGKQLQLTADDHGKLSESVKKTAAAIGVSYTEMSRYLKGYASLTGSTEGGTVPALFARGLGMDLGTTTEAFGQLGRFGAVKPDKDSMTRFASMLAQAVSTGRFQGRQEELLRALVGFSAQQTRILGSAQGSAQFLGMLTSMNAYGPAGLKGELGGAYLETLSGGIRHPGGGGTGLYLMSQALGQKDYFRLKYRMEEGAFGPGENLSHIMPYLHSLFPGADEESRLQRATFMSSLFPGTSIHQNMAFEDVYHQHGAPNLNRLYKRLTDLGFEKNLGAINPDQLGLLARLNDLQSGDKSGLETILNSPELSGMSQDEKNKLIQSGNIDDALRAVSKETFQSEGDKTRVELGKISQHLADLGEQALPKVVDIAKDVNSIYEWLQKRWPSTNNLGQPPAYSNEGLYWGGAIGGVAGFIGGGPLGAAAFGTAGAGLGSVYDRWLSPWNRAYYEHSSGEKRFPLPAPGTPPPEEHSWLYNLLSPTAAYADVLPGISGVESGGNYNAYNHNSGARGKYQIMPGTWRQFAPMAGLSPMAPMTPENQERVAQVMQLYYSKRYGGDPRLIAGAWYSGQGVADALLRGRMSPEAFYRPQYSKGHIYPSIAEYIQNATGEAWHLGDKPSAAYLNSLDAEAYQSSQNSASQSDSNVIVNLNHKEVLRVPRTGNGSGFVIMSPAAPEYSIDAQTY